VSRTSLVGGTVATLADEAPLTQATIVIDDETIVDVGQVGVAGRVIDCTGKLILPGFVNAHTHLTEVLYRGLSAGLDHVDWVSRKHGLQNVLDESGAAVGASLACLEILRAGAIAFLDPEVEPRQFAGVARGAGASGLRGGLSLAIQARHGYRAQGGHDAHAADGGHGGHTADAGHRGHAGKPGASAASHGEAADGRTRHERPGAPGEGHGQATTPASSIELPPTSGRVSAWLGPRAMNAMTDELTAAVAATLRTSGARITFHCSEDEREVAEVRAESGLTPARYAETFGLLVDRAVLAHGVFLEPDDLVAIAAAGASVVHCPVSNAKTGHGIAPLGAMQAAGINVCVGSDGGMSNDTYDILQELRVAGLVHRAAQHNPAATSGVQVLRMATRNGTRALGLQGGTIEAGAPADLVIIDLRQLGSWPTHDPLDSLAFSSSKEVIDSVMVAGELLLDAGRPTRIDEARLLAEAAEVAAEAARAAGLESWVRRA
jgi:cytosine/adenosine deaminase-related metal-dependent hydrolase